MWEVGFEGIGLTGTVTFLKGAGITVANENHVGKISAGQTIDVCDAEDVFYGVIGKVDEGAGILGLERHGFNEVSFSGTITPGYKELVGDGLGGVKAPASAGTGRMFHVVEVNDTDKLLFLDLG